MLFSDMVLDSTIDGGKAMNILFCGDRNIADGIMMATLSLLGCVKEQLDIYILTASVSGAERNFMAMPKDFAKLLERTLKERSADSTVTLIDITDLVEQYPPLANMETRFTPCCMLRLYADLVPELPDRLLYLDNDIICRKDFAEFYHRDMTDTELAGVLDYYGRWFFRRNIFKMDYLNSGVLLLSLPVIRQTGLFEKCRQRCREKKMFMPDQSAINKLSVKKDILPRRYNEQRRLHSDTIFQHFTTSFRFFPWFHTVSVKPWNIEGMHETLKLHEYDELLERYINMKDEIRRTLQ